MKILSGLSEGQVLQRQGSKGAEVAISGNSSQDGPLLVTIFRKNAPLKNWRKKPVGQVAGAIFSVSLKNIPAGGPYRMEFSSGKDSFQIKTVFVGDVWILAGQSNMQGCGKLPKKPAAHPMVRSFSMRREWREAVEPMTLLAESPDLCHNGRQQCSVSEGKMFRKVAANGVGPGGSFAEEMWKRSGVPQGLICTAHGGTSMAQWTPQREMEGNVSLYGSLLDSVAATGQKVAGVLWYQGESDAGPEVEPLYTGRMKKLVASLRKDLKQPLLPWFVVQIARVFREETPEGRNAWNGIQEQQRLLPKAIKNLAVVSAIDLSLDDSIHISREGQQRLGIRLAREADRLVQGNRGELPSPQLRSIRYLEGSVKGTDLPEPLVEVTFDGIKGSLKSNGEPSGFTVVDHEGRDLRAIFRTTLKGNVARLHLRSPLVHTRLCYGWGLAPICNITDERDQALPVFQPRFLTKAKAFYPFIRDWKTVEPVETSKPLNRIEAPRLDEMNPEVKAYYASDFGLEGFVNEHARWVGRKGHGYFEAWMELPEPMRLEVLMGYDGPFRLWFNRKSFFTDMKGINPCVADKSRRGIFLPAGRHSIQVAMDLAHGSSWGFFLRFVRKDVAMKQIEEGAYTKPRYGV